MSPHATGTASDSSVPMPIACSVASSVGSGVSMVETPIATGSAVDFCKSVITCGATSPSEKATSPSAAQEPVTIRAG
jgi:hypothetical protein